VAAQLFVGRYVPYSTHTRSRNTEAEGEDVWDAEKQSVVEGERVLTVLGLGVPPTPFDDVTVTVEERLAENVLVTEMVGDVVSLGVRRPLPDAVEEVEWLGLMRVVRVGEGVTANTVLVLVVVLDTLGEEEPVFELVVVAVVVGESRFDAVRAPGLPVAHAVDVVEPLCEGVTDAE
jgi:hypothetical protein